MTQFGNITLTPSKVQQILEAGRRQLSAEEFEELSNLLFDLEIYGFTPWINVRLGTLMSKIQWELELEPSPEWDQALQACDRAFLSRELKEMCEEYGASPVGHKKQLCARLFRRKVPEVLTVMEPYLKGKTPEQIKEEVEQYARVERLPQTESLWVSKLRDIKDRLERIYRTNPDEFYYRKKLIRQAIRDREKGQTKIMPELTLPELQELLRFTDRLYR